MAYAITRAVVTRADNGHKEFNFSEILGSAASAALSTNLYHLVGDRTLPILSASGEARSATTH
jgi:hypothetical protein